MSRLAALVMFLAWLLYAAVPVIGMPGMAMAAQNPLAFSAHAGNAAKMAIMSHSVHDMKQPCPHGGKACAAPFCAACLTLVPELAFQGEISSLHGSPAPAIQQAFVSPVPAPLTPPPRA